MKNALVIAALVLASGSALAVTATWTGRSEMATSISGAMGFRCEYYYAGKKFWLMFSGSCPATVEVQ